MNLYSSDRELQTAFARKMKEGGKQINLLSPPHVVVLLKSRHNIIDRTPSEFRRERRISWHEASVELLLKKQNDSEHEKTRRPQQHHDYTIHHHESSIGPPGADCRQLCRQKKKKNVAEQITALPAHPRVADHERNDDIKKHTGQQKQQQQPQQRHGCALPMIQCFRRRSQPALPPKQRRRLRRINALTPPSLPPD